MDKFVFVLYIDADGCKAVYYKRSLVKVFRPEQWDDESDDEQDRAIMDYLQDKLSIPLGASISMSYRYLDGVVSTWTEELSEAEEARHG